VTRRWSSEAQVLEEMERLADMSMDLAAQYKGQAVESAEAEALHKSLRARRILAAQASHAAGTGRAPSMALAEVVAEADDDVADALQDRLVKSAIADSTRETLRSVRTNQDALRTAAASHRTTPI
jgi:hypothetical protein